MGRSASGFNGEQIFIVNWRVAAEERSEAATGCAATLFEGPLALIAACGSDYTWCSRLGKASFRESVFK
jgi:hypothetical protein